MGHDKYPRRTRGVSRANRESMIARLTEDVMEAFGVDVQVSRALAGKATGYQMHAVIDGKAHLIAGPLPGVMVQHYLEGMLVAKNLQQLCRDGGHE